MREVKLSTTQQRVIHALIAGATLKRVGARYLLVTRNGYTSRVLSRTVDALHMAGMIRHAGLDGDFNYTFELVPK